MRIGMLTQWYDPEPGPASLPGALARGLVARGHDVQVVTGFPNYPTGQIAEGYQQRRRMDEVLDDVRVRRVALYANHDGSTVRRLANYGSFAASAYASGLDVLRDVDALWVNYSPVTIGLPMFAQLHRCKTPTLVHVLDLWPDTLFASGFANAGGAGKLIHSSLDRWTNRMYRKVDKVAYISPGVGTVLAERGVPAGKLAYAPMWADEVAFPFSEPAADRSQFGVPDDHVLLVYAGTLGNAQDLSSLVKAVAGVKDSPLTCLIAGSGIEEQALRALADREGATNLRFLGRLGKPEMTALMAASDVHYVGLNSHPLAAITMPSKVQTILASGRTVVGSLEGDAAGVIREAGGWAVTPGDVSSLAHVLREVAYTGRTAVIARGASARRVYDEQFSYAVGVDRVEALLQTAVDRKRP